MLMQMGPVVFDVHPFNTHEYALSSTTDFVAKPVLGARQPLEFVGEGDEKLTINGRLLPKHIGGLATMAMVQAIRKSAVPQFVVRGDGKIYGWFVIESVEENAAHLAIDGVGQQVEFVLVLRRCGAPSVASFAFSLFEGLF